eukprot:2460479-Alexandrium_andersonii.AAC.1
MVWCLQRGTGSPKSSLVLDTFLSCWTSWAGLPQSIFVDRGREFAKDFLAYMMQYGIETENAALEAHEQVGRVECMGGFWKE